MLIIRQLTQKDVPQTLKLINYLWKLKNQTDIEKVFYYKYEKNIQNNNMLLYIAEDDGRIVGFRGLTLEKYKYKDYLFDIANLSDAIVDPTVQRQGIFLKLTETALKFIESNTVIIAILTLTSNPKSTSGYKKLGWIEFAERRSYYFINTFKINPWRNKRINICFDILTNSDYNLFADFNENNITKIITALKDQEFYLKKYSKIAGNFYSCKYYVDGNFCNYIIFNKYNSILNILEIGLYNKKQLKQMLFECSLITGIKRISLFHLETENLFCNTLSQVFTINSNSKLFSILFRRENPKRLINVIEGNMIKCGINIDFKNILLDKRNWVIQPINTDSYFMHTYNQ